MTNLVDKLKNQVALRFVSSEVGDERIAICNSCEEYNKTLDICKKCGCYMPAKSKLAKAKCPLNKWQPI